MIAVETLLAVLKSQFDAEGNSEGKKTEIAQSPTKSARSTEGKKSPRKRTAYNCFQKEKWAILKEEHPDATFGEIVKLVVAQWRQITEEEKKVCFVLSSMYFIMVLLDGYAIITCA